MCKDVVKNVKRRGFYMIEEVNRTTEKKTKKNFFFNTFRHCSREFICNMLEKIKSTRGRVPGSVHYFN